MAGKFTFILCLLLGAASCQGQQRGGKVSKNEAFEGSINAPEFPSHLTWLNTDRRLSLGEFRGKLVLLDFWTFCCINCMHIIPDLKKLEEKYPEELVVIGVHSAKFTNEKDSQQIRQAILRYEIRHPVINDSNLEVWSSYGVHAWPTLVLINPNGRIMGVHSGEGIFQPFDAALSQAIPYFEKKGELKRGPLKLALEDARRANTLLAFPGKISADPRRRLLIISDTNHNRIILSDPDGAIQEVMGSGNLGFKDGPFEAAEFHHPQGTAVDGEIVYIADTENHAIRAANLRTRRVTTVLGTGRQGTTAGLSSPWDLVVENGKLYIAMAGVHQLWVADLKTWEAGPYAGSSQEARIDGPLQQAALAQPSGLTTDGRKLYFADSETSSIRSADLGGQGAVKTIVGQDLFEYGDKDGARGEVRLQHPLGVLFKDGLLYVADTYNSKIKVVDPAKGVSATYAGSGRHGLADGKLSSAQFNEPGGLAFLDGKLYVADTNNHQIRAIDTTAREVRTLEFTNLERLAPADRFRGRLVELPARQIQAGMARMTLDVKLPAGYKFARGAPFYLKWSSSDERVAKFEGAPKEPRFPVEVSLATSAGTGELTVDAVVYYCTEQSTACFVDPVRLKVPVQITPQGAPMLKLEVPVKTPR
jgi:thiol-disulfide isomerase/thioredoxin